jgi:hypothetical protein
MNHYRAAQYSMENPQVKALFDFAGSRLENFTHETLWDLVTIISAECSLSHPRDGQDVALEKMDETRSNLDMSWDAVVGHSLEILDGISRLEAKKLLWHIVTIATSSEIH